ncbi:hypothetical protein E2C01_051437 [Portunus trituberculatus]|uniref:Uncharacterized protein n=1 Tax=Portunus trituberculatus TaxID=210409 RepID=A0A5B7GJJ3_PORTR|nr:hypothetical protein [Portunus trituberculatus]
MAPLPVLSNLGALYLGDSSPCSPRPRRGLLAFRHREGLRLCYLQRPHLLPSLFPPYHLPCAIHPSWAWPPTPQHYY